MAIICFDCINDEYLKLNNLVHQFNDDCDYCDEKHTPCISIVDLAGLLSPIINLYSPIEEFMPIFDMKNSWVDGRYVWEAIQEDWGLFSKFNYDILEELFNEILEDDIKDQSLYLSSFVLDEYEYYGISWQLTKDLEEEWRNFCEELKYRNRYFPKKTVDTKLLAELLDLLNRRFN